MPEQLYKAHMILPSYPHWCDHVDILAAWDGKSDFISYKGNDHLRVIVLHQMAAMEAMFREKALIDAKRSLGDEADHLLNVYVEADRTKHAVPATFVFNNKNTALMFKMRWG
jgi:hypothetical protein